MSRSIKNLLKPSLLWISLIVTGFLLGKGLAQETYPSKPIMMIYGWGAGGMLDVLIRTISRAAEKEIGQPIVIENKVGAGGVIAKNYVSKSKPDGYTLGTTVTSTYIVQPHTRKTLYDPMTDIVDIMTFAKYNNALAVKVESPLNNYEDVIAYAKNNPNKFTYATAGVGTIPHIVAERMAMKEGFKWTHVPFKSGPEGVNAVLGGHVDGVFMGSADIVPHVKANKLKVVLITSDTRWPSVPNVPTILEKGYDFYHMSYISIYGPKGLPEPIRQRLENVFKNAMKDPKFVETINNFQLETAYLSGKEYSVKWKSDYHEMGKILSALGLIEK